jgi:hypothetical protein
MQQSATMEGYSQSYGQARFDSWTPRHPHNIATWWNEYEYDDIVIVSHRPHRKDILSWTGFVWKNGYQRINIDKVMDQSSFDDGISQYSMVMQIWISLNSPYIPSTSSIINYIKSYISTQQPTLLNRYWRSYCSSNFGSEIHHRSINFRRAITTTIFNFWR